jgi:hypothetical protein
MAAAGALRNLAAGGPEYQKAIGESGAVGPLIKILGKRGPNVPPGMPVRFCFFSQLFSFSFFLILLLRFPALLFLYHLLLVPSVQKLHTQKAVGEWGRWLQAE